MAAYATRQPDSTLKVALINKDLKRAARVEIRAGRDFRSLPALEATLGSAAVDGLGRWSPHQSKPFLGGATLSSRCRQQVR